MSEANYRLEELHPLITEERDTGNGHYLSLRHYPGCDEVEMVAIRLESGDSLKRGGGAKRKHDDKAAMDEATLRKSVARARTTVRRKAMTMNADRMLTLTFRENVTSIDEGWDCFKYFCKLMRFRYRERFQYIAVPEYQKRGAVHFHMAITGFYHANTVRRFWLRAAGKFGGNIDITSPRKAVQKNSWNPRCIANYLSKYLTKSDSVEFNRRRYSSGGAVVPPEPARGWIALGIPLVQVMRECVGKLTRKQVTCIWESEQYFGITYLAT